MNSKRAIQPYKIRGIDALFGGEPQQTPESTPKKQSAIALNQIILPQHQQPRRYFDPLKQKQLEQSIQEHGILEPLLVRLLERDRYELVAGERRYRAAKAIGLAEVPVTIKQLSDRQAFQLSLVENLQREDLNPVEETEGVLQLLALELEQTMAEVRLLLYQMKNGIEKLKKEQPEKDFEVRDNVIPNPDSDVEQKVEIAFRGLSKSWYSFTCNRLPLLNLPEDVLETLRQGKIEYTKTRLIAQIKDERDRAQFLAEVIEQQLSLSQIRERVEEFKQLKPQETAQSPKARLQEVTRKVSHSQVWKDPKKWKRVEGLLKKLEALIEENVPGI
ncbi:MAG: ParB/RepB/Spo0J family partition protein [Oscillatoriales cyanobacterium RM1_1_9]|nr:ParB/RepB/Spo0J family partition protein [Oscillatoriales cyanobacterium SM2_3_0]NJO45692.1 ParB/RepB/Spo0J family partition protein [Oscillatoriales cyanobacterium RM2_1_1]NJO70516.1 ParB/RepB/Spo0J family partition protein [Oscillatoriales cyanobacterium RM1_1_9]